MSRNVIEVPVARKDEAVFEFYHQDPVTGKKGLIGRDYSHQRDPSKNYVELYDANGNTIFTWKATSGKPLDQNRFKTAHFLAKQSFDIKGVQ